MVKGNALAYLWLAIALLTILPGAQVAAGDEGVQTAVFGVA
jgi:hypothetical protein